MQWTRARSIYSRYFLCLISEHFTPITAHCKIPAFRSLTEQQLYIMAVLSPRGHLQGRSLLLVVSVLTSLGFMLIGYDNGLMGGLGVLFLQ